MCKLSTGAATVLLALLFSVVSAKPAVLDRIVAVVNDDIVTLSDLILFENFSARRAASNLTNESETDRPRIQQLVDERLLSAEAKRFETERPTTGEVENSFLSAKRLFPNDTEFQNALKRFGFQVSDVKAQAAIDAFVNKFLDQRINFFVFVRPDDISRHFEEHADAYSGRSLEEATPEIQKELQTQLSNKRLATYLDSLRSKATIRINPPEPR